jgi:hypothetical protein
MGRFLAWFCLVLVASTTAYGLQLIAAAIQPSAAAASQVTSATVAHHILIVAVDPVTGDRTQMECGAPTDSFASEVLLVDANDLPAVARVCKVVGAPTVTPTQHEERESFVEKRPAT